MEFVTVKVTDWSNTSPETATTCVQHECIHSDCKEISTGLQVQDFEWEQRTKTVLLDHFNAHAKAEQPETTSATPSKRSYEHIQISHIIF